MSTIQSKGLDNVSCWPGRESLLQRRRHQSQLRHTCKHLQLCQQSGGVLRPFWPVAVAGNTGSSLPQSSLVTVISVKEPLTVRLRRRPSRRRIWQACILWEAFTGKLNAQRLPAETQLQTGAASKQGNHRNLVFLFFGKPFPLLHSHSDLFYS